MEFPDDTSEEKMFYAAFKFVRAQKMHPELDHNQIIALHFDEYPAEERVFQ